MSSRDYSVTSEKVTGLPGTVLMLTANADEAVKLGLAEEYKHISLRLRQRGAQDKLRHWPEARIDELVDLLLDHRDVRVVHFSGHGSPAGLEFETASGAAERADEAAVAAVFAELEHIDCVFLNACHSASQAQLIAQHVEWVIGMGSAIKDSAAIAFSGRFYAVLASDAPVDAAFRIALAGTRLVDAQQASVPRLYHRGSLQEQSQVQPSSDERDAATQADFGRLGGTERLSVAELEQYRDRTLRWHESLPRLGFRAAPNRAVGLQELVVTLDAVVDDRRRGDIVASGREFEAQAQGRGAVQLSLTNAFGHAKERGCQALILLGDPGTGKTTFLKQALLKTIEEGPASLGLPDGTLPVFLPLRELKDTSKTLGQFIQEQQEQLDTSGTVPPDLGQRLVERGELLLLFDGLDEIAEVVERKRASQWLNKVRVNSKDCHLLVSSRYAGYVREVALANEFLELNLKPLDDGQMQALVYNCYAQFDSEGGGQGEDHRARADELLGELRSPAFAGVARLFEMSRNPLLLTGICLVHQVHGTLPKARSDLYSQCVEVLLDKWEARQPNLELDKAQSQAVLEGLAGWMHGEEGRKSATKAELLEPLGAELGKLEKKGQEAQKVPEAGSFLTAVQNESGLLVSYGKDSYGYTHLGFQEFLAARAQLARPELAAVCKELAPRFGDSWWQEVILLFLAQEQAGVFEAFMGELVKQPRFAELWGSEVMQLCLREAHAPVAEPFVDFLRSDERSWWVRALSWLGRPFGWEPTAMQGWSRRQLGAAMLLAYEMRYDLKKRDDARLSGHPAKDVRQWWTSARERPELRLSERGGVELVRIPGGTFWMGSPEGVSGSDEHPRHEVKLASFCLARTPVTNAQYGEYLEANPGTPEPKHWGDRRYNQPTQPVVGVSWEDAQAYCAWAGLVLPTEAQWEYACRAETKTTYWSGDSEEDLGRVGWTHENSDGRLHAVGEKPANPWGLVDMHGNVWEWCRDNYGAYEGHPAQPGDGLRHEPVGDVYRVMRGGSWYYTAVGARSAYRSRNHPGYRVSIVGFRPAQGHL